MSHHPAYTMGAICVAGGIFGYISKRSVPSLVAGLGIGVLYGIGGLLIKQNKEYGHETSLAASVILAGSM
ncbi:12163_t:CDS:2, partial [Acaulospora morrowiae]